MDGLYHNLLSVSHSIDKNNWVIFDSEECLIINKKDLTLNKDELKIKLRAPRDSNYYTVSFNSNLSENCFMGKTDESWVWQKY